MPEIGQPGLPDGVTSNVPVPPENVNVTPWSVTDE